MTFSELNFKPKAKDYDCGMQAKCEFSNGYGASVITGKGSYTSDNAPYELAVFFNGSLCYDTPITDDVITHLKEQDVKELLDRIEAL